MPDAIGGLQYPVWIVDLHVSQPAPFSHSHTQESGCPLLLLPKQWLVNGRSGEWSTWEELCQWRGSKFLEEDALHRAAFETIFACENNTANACRWWCMPIPDDPVPWSLTFYYLSSSWSCDIAAWQPLHILTARSNIKSGQELKKIRQLCSPFLCRWGVVAGNYQHRTFSWTQERLRLVAGDPVSEKFKRESSW